MIIANVNRIFTEQEIQKLLKKSDELLNLGVEYFVFSDVGIYQYFYEKNLHHNLIYNARTMITNTEMLKFGKKMVYMHILFQMRFRLRI